MSDHDLSPFENFGQFGHGMMDNRVFDQDKYWVNIVGTPFRLEDMTSEYRTNVINFLVQNAEYFHASVSLREAAEIAEDSINGAISGDLIAISFGGAAAFELTPDAWLEATPLMRKLRRLEQDG